MVSKSRQAQRREASGKGSSSKGQTPTDAPESSDSSAIKNPKFVGGAAIVLLVATIAFWWIASGMLPDGDDENASIKMPQVDRSNLSSKVNELLDDA